MLKGSLLRLPLLLIACALSLSAQTAPTAQQYERAFSLGAKLRTVENKAPSSPIWRPGSDVLLYRKNIAGGAQWIAVDASTLKSQPAFDHEKLAASINKALGVDKYKALTLPLYELHFGDKPEKLEIDVERARLRCLTTTYVCEKVETPADFGVEYSADEYAPWRRPQPPSVASPDGKLEAYIYNFNVYVRAAGDAKNARQMSWEGSEGDYYSLNSLWWSPDSKRIAAYRTRPGYRREIHYVESSPADQLQPKHSNKVYPKAGDVLDRPQPVLFDVAAHKQTIIDNALFPSIYELSDVEWRKDSHAFTFEYNQRGHQAYRVIEVDAANAAARAVVDEQSKTFITYQRMEPTQYGSGKLFRYDVADGREIIWLSERDGWAHLYLYDGATGKVKNQITRGEWVVRGVDHVDETARQIWFYAGGTHAGKDPYYRHAYRINFDGSGLTEMTEAEANHTVVYSPSGKYYADLYSRVDLPPVLEVRRVADRAKLAELAHGEDGKLKEAGWRAPEPFVAKGRDGKTDIWGVVYYPANFDASKKYPVAEDIYAGPHGSFVPKDFSTRIEPLTELGFVVVQIDGMGTNNRSKAFQDVAYKNLKDAGFEDRILWHKAFAASHAWYDISRVGIFGGSAGGQNAMAAVLFHPEFYKAAVANCGSHDNRMDKIWWNEQWMGYPVGPEYAASSNVDNAWRLKGKLMLVLGEMDQNVDPSTTMQVVNALIKANKYFDFLMVPGGGHGAGGWYGQRKLADFFVRNLMGVEPQNWNETELDKK